MAATIWAQENGDCGACQRCDPPSSTRGIWNTACGPTDVSLTMRNLPEGQRGVCSSRSTEGTCDWKKGTLKDLQVTLHSQHCDPVWVAPLWITPSQEKSCKWNLPQEASGEIDVFERGCSRPDGFLLSYGSSDVYIKRSAWKEKGNYAGPTALTALMRFGNPERSEKDEITTWWCPVTSDDLSLLTDDQLVARKCEKTDVETGYYARTSDPGHTPQTCLFHLVTDIWNKPGINAGCDSGHDPNTACEFQITGLKLGFSEIPDGWTSSVCKNLLRSS